MNNTELSTTAIQMAELSKMYLQAMSDINDTLTAEIGDVITPYDALHTINSIVVEAGKQHDTIMNEKAIDRVHRMRREATPPKLGARDMHDTECRDETTDNNQDN